MKYSEIARLLDSNNIDFNQVLIVMSVKYQLETDIPEEEFEKICGEIYEKCQRYSYDACEIYDEAEEILLERGYEVFDILK